MPEREMKRKRIVIVDGYNVIHRVPELKRILGQGLASAREALIRYCEGWLSKRGDISRVYVVFDGDSSVAGAPCGGARGVWPVFTGTGEEADKRILDIVREGAQSAEYVVVSDDGYVALASRRFTAARLSVREFYRSPRLRGWGEPRAVGGEDKTALHPGEQKEINEELKREWGIH